MQKTIIPFYYNSNWETNHNCKLCESIDEYYKDIVTEREVTRRTAIGSQYTDIALKSPEGKVIKVSDFVGKNKVTMIDFWASWCKPCRQEMPNFIKVYNEYKSKGFEVVGVSLDENKEAWVSAIKKLSIP